MRLSGPTSSRLLAGCCAVLVLTLVTACSAGEDTPESTPAVTTVPTLAGAPTSPDDLCESWLPYDAVTALGWRSLDGDDVGATPQGCTRRAGADAVSTSVAPLGEVRIEAGCAQAERSEAPYVIDPAWLSDLEGVESSCFAPFPGEAATGTAYAGAVLDDDRLVLIEVDAATTTQNPQLHAGIAVLVQAALDS